MFELKQLRHGTKSDKESYYRDYHGSELLEGEEGVSIFYSLSKFFYISKIFEFNIIDLPLDPCVNVDVEYVTLTRSYIERAPDGSFVALFGEDYFPYIMKFTKNIDEYHVIITDYEKKISTEAFVSQDKLVTDMAAMRLNYMSVAKDVLKGVDYSYLDYYYQI